MWIWAVLSTVLSLAYSTPSVVQQRRLAVRVRPTLLFPPPLSVSGPVRGRPLGLLAPVLRPRRWAYRLSAFYKVPVRRAVAQSDDHSAPPVSLLTCLVYTSAAAAAAWCAAWWVCRVGA